MTDGPAVLQHQDVRAALDAAATGGLLTARQTQRLTVLAAGAGPSGTLVLRAEDLVIKLEPEATPPSQAAARLALAVGVPGVFLQPIATVPLVVNGRSVSIWPYRRPVDPDRPADVPWTAAASLLARLHRSPVPQPGGNGQLPAQGMPAAVAAALDRMAATPDAALRDARVPPWARAAVVAAAVGLPAWTMGTAAQPLPGRPATLTLTHGDWHLGQMVHDTVPLPDPHEGWRLIDVDCLGLGDPIWDLARPAMWLSAGVMDPADWQRFLQAYRQQGGPALPSGDPWPLLEPVARAIAVQAAASAIARAGRTAEPPDDDAIAFIEACQRIARTGQ